MQRVNNTNVLKESLINNLGISKEMKQCLQKTYFSKLNVVLSEKEKNEIFKDKE